MRKNQILLSYAILLCVSIPFAIFLDAKILRLYADYPPSWFIRYPYVFVCTVVSVFSGLVILNSAGLFILYIRMRGAIRLREVRDVWRIKYRTPYILHTTNTRIRRVRYEVVAMMYILHACILAGVSALIAESYLQFLFAALAIFFISLVPTQILVHGRPPAVLFLARSGEAAVALNRDLIIAFRKLGVGSLLQSLDTPDSTFVNWLGSYRTLDAEGDNWRDSFRALAGMSHVIVVDGRADSAILREEVAWLQVSGHSRKALIVGDAGGGVLLDVDRAKFLGVVGHGQVIARVAERVGRRP